EKKDFVRMPTGNVADQCSRVWLRGCLGALLVFGQLICIRASLAESLPVEAFASLPRVSSVQQIQLSPSGEHLAYVLNSGGYSVLAVQEIESGKRIMLRKTDNEKYVFRWLKWINPERFVFSVYFPDRRYGVATGETRLLAAGIHDDKVKLLLKPRHDKEHRHISQVQDRIVSILPKEPDHILVAMDAEEPTFPGVYKVNVNNGKRQRVQRHKKPIRSWVADQEGNIRAGVGFERLTTNRSLWIRRSGEKKWTLVEEYKTFGRAEITPLGFGNNPDQLYVRDLHEGKYAVYLMDLASDNLARELVASDPDYDVSGGLVWSPKTGEVIGVEHAYAAGSVIYFDKQREAFQESLESTFTQTHNLIVGLTDDEQQYLLYTSASDVGGVFYHGKRDKGTVSAMLYNYPRLKDQELSHSKRITYAARDGQEIEGYLWLPVDSASKKLPLILFPHGGPMSSDRGGFDYWTQFFTHRGYAVLQPNFRGSTGYGHDFSMASLRQWGLAMQDDLEDGVQSLVSQGIVDADRVCIVGASYGGYAALMGAVKTPDTYRCAISFAGIFSLPDLRATSRHYVNKKIVNAQIGSDKDQLRATSPLYHADKIKAPVLIAHGDIDRTVPVSQSRKMAKALKKSGREYQYLELENGSHSLSNEANRLGLFRAMDAFLAKHLPVER
ncbi:MAG: alpha/beta hydrolase family protein, partial [Halioglobus sp.]